MLTLTPAARAKTRIARMICHPRVGRLVRYLFRGTVPNRGCWVDVSDPSVSDRVCASLAWGLYESAEIRLVRRHLPKDLDVVDLGASLGVVSAHVAKRLAGRRKLVCVEANAALLDIARRNVTHNVPGQALEVVHAVLAYGTEPVASFSASQDTLTSSLATAGDEGTQVPTVTLSRVLSQNSIGDFSLVCDVEGAEAEMISADKEAFRRCHFIIIELHSTKLGDRIMNVPDLLSQVEGLGFRLVEQQGPVFALKRATAAFEDAAVGKP
jgi:FkbM family methyltransferase